MFSRFHSDELEATDGFATVVPRHELMNVRAVTQLEKDTILVCYDSKILFGGFIFQLLLQNLKDGWIVYKEIVRNLRRNTFKLRLLLNISFLFVNLSDFLIIHSLYVLTLGHKILNRLWSGTFSRFQTLITVPCFSDILKVVNLQGKLKNSKRQTSELHFDFSINSIGKSDKATLNFRIFNIQYRLKTTSIYQL